MNKIIYAAVIGITLGTTPVRAEVSDMRVNGFTIKTNIHLNASQKKAFDQLLNVGDWWNDDHTWFGSAKAMQIEPKAGGCWCEVNGNNTARHGSVSQLVPGQILRLDAELGPLQELGVSGALTYKLEHMGSGSHLYVTYNVSGMTKEQVEEWAPAVDFVINEQISRYGRLINTGSTKE